MISLVLTSIGVVMFVLGISCFVKSNKKEKDMTGYIILTYIGFFMALLGWILSMELIFTSLDGKLPNTLPIITFIFISIIVIKFFLNPLFSKVPRSDEECSTKCIKCNKNFTFYDRLKSIINTKIKCSNCGGIYKVKFNIDRGIYIGIIYMINVIIFNHIIILDDFILQLQLQTLIMILTFPLFDLIPNKYQRYEKIN